MRTQKFGLAGRSPSPCSRSSPLERTYGTLWLCRFSALTGFSIVGEVPLRLALMIRQGRVGRRFCGFGGCRTDLCIVHSLLEMRYDSFSYCTGQSSVTLLASIARSVCRCDRSEFFRIVLAQFVLMSLLHGQCIQV